MNKKIFFLILFSLLTVPAMSFGAAGNIQELMATLVNGVVWVVFGGIAVICIVYAGILFLSSGGDPAKVKLARNSFLYGVAGIVVGILAYSIVGIIENAIK
jgi:hypothetical protein